MPVVRTLIDIQDVIPILTAKGYGVNKNHAFHLQLTVQGQRQFSTGSWERVCLKGLGKTELTAILERAESAAEAALLVERVSLGQIASAVEETNPKGQGMGLSAEDLANIIDRRVSNEVDKRVAEIMADMTAMKAEFAKMVATAMEKLGGAKPAEAPVAPKKRGRPKKEIDRSNPEVDRILSEMNIPAVPVAPV